MPSADQPAACHLAPAVGSNGQPDILLVQKSFEPHDAADLEIAPKEIAHEGGMLLDDMERPIVDPIAERASVNEVGSHGSLTCSPKSNSRELCLSSMLAWTTPVRRSMPASRLSVPCRTYS